MLQLNLFGEQRLTAWGADVLSGRSRTLELLAYLVVHPETSIPRLFLAGTFWPESSDAQAQTNLRRELHNLRVGLGEANPLETVDGAIRWVGNGDIRVDVRSFDEQRIEANAAAARGDEQQFLEHAEAAVAHYRGELMPGNYSDWVLPKREHLAELCAKLCAEATNGWLNRGQGHRALTMARRRVDIRVLDESGYRDLMRVQLSLGESTEAMYTFHKCAQALEHELGVIPGDEIQALFQKMISGRQPNFARSPGPRADTTVGRVQSTGREIETDQLGQLWAETERGSCSMVVLSGGPGVGKTHLARALESHARAGGALVARARCVDSGGLIPLAPVAGWLSEQAFAPLLSRLPVELQREVGRLLPGAFGEPRRTETRPGSRAMVDAWQRYRFFEALAHAVGTADRPMLLVLDDLHWCDADTAAWISFLLSGPHAKQLLLVATMRAPFVARSPAVAAMITTLRNAGVLQELSIDPLGIKKSAELAAQVRGAVLSPTQAHVLHAATGGYPLFILEAARSGAAAAESQDTGYYAVLGHRFEQLTAAAKHLAELVSAYGGEITLDLLSEAADLENKDLVRAVDELWRLGILAPVGNGYDFVHDLVRRATYEKVSPATRWLLHRRLAQSVELLHAANLEPVAAVLAEQYALGSNPVRALEFALRAGAAASRIYANSTALDSYRTALELIAAQPAGRERDERELSTRTAMSPPLTALHGYSAPELLENLERSVQLAQELGHRKIHAASLIGLFAGRYVQGKNQLSHRIGLRALELSQGDADLTGQSHFAVAGGALAMGRLQEAIEHFAACYEGGQNGYSFILGTRLEIHARAWASHAHWLAGDTVAALQLGSEALIRADASGHPYTRAVALGYVCLLRQLSGDLAGLEQAVEELLGICRRYQIVYYRQWAEIFAGWLTGGEMGVARIREGIMALEAQGARARIPYWRALLAEALAENGQLEQGRGELQNALIQGSAMEETCWDPVLSRLRERLG